jgi:hypothetical protein
MFAATMQRLTGGANARQRPVTQNRKQEDSVRIKIKGGTVAHHERPLCETCRWSTVIRGARLGQEIVECNQLSFQNQRVPFPVVSCSGYTDRNHPSIREMEEMAWLLRSDARRNQVGFVQGKRLPDEERFVLEED